MKPSKILIADDSLIVLKTLSNQLRAHGHQVLTADSGGEAVRLARGEKPDLILLDISFPPDVGHGGGVPWDGFLIMDWLRRMDESKSIPVIIITGGDPIKYEHRALAAGAVAFFHKPIDSAALLEIIRKTLADREPEACLFA
jgi:two-component system cell cycle response regulator